MDGMETAVTTPHDLPAPFEVIERAVQEHYSSTPGWIAAEVLAALDKNGWMIRR